MTTCEQMVSMKGRDFSGVSMGMTAGGWIACRRDGTKKVRLGKRIMNVCVQHAKFLLEHGIADEMV